MKFKTLSNGDFNNMVLRSFQKQIFSACEVDISAADLKKICRNALKHDWTCEKFLKAVYELVEKREDEILTRSSSALLELMDEAIKKRLAKTKY